MQVKVARNCRRLGWLHTLWWRRKQKCMQSRRRCLSIFSSFYQQNVSSHWIHTRFDSHMLPLLTHIMLMRGNLNVLLIPQLLQSWRRPIVGPRFIRVVREEQIFSSFTKFMINETDFNSIAERVLDIEVVLKGILTKCCLSMYFTISIRRCWIHSLNVGCKVLPTSCNYYDALRFTHKGSTFQLRTIDEEN